MSKNENYAYQLAGQSGMNGLLAIVNTSNKDFKKLTEAINDSTGAAERMADIKLDNLEGDTTLLESATQGLGIEIYEQMDDGLRAIVQSITSEVGDITEYLRENRFIEEFADNIKENIPTVVRNLKNAGESIAEFSEPFINIAGWMLEHPEVIESTLTGIVTTIVSLKAAQKVYDVAQSFGTLAGILTNPFAVAILAVGAALGGAAGLATYINKCDIAAKNQNLAEHFGDISLSMEELEDVASRIINDKSIEGINNALEELSKVDNISEEIDDTVASLNKMNWKVEVGMKLSKSEKKQYKEDIKSYISQTQELVEQERYAISLNINLLTDGNGELTSQVDSYFSGKQKKLEKLGKKLQKTVNKAFNDGLLTIDEEKKIQDIQAQMAAVSDGMAKSSFDANMQILEKEWEGKEINAESFENLQDLVNDQLDELKNGYKESLQESIAAESAMLNDGEITKKQYDSNVDKLWNEYYEKVAEGEQNASEFLTGKIAEQYSNELNTADGKYDEILKSYMGNTEEFRYSAGLMWGDMPGQFMTDVLPQDTVDALGELAGKLDERLKSLEELKQHYQSQIEDYNKAGEEVPQEITDKLAGIEDDIQQITTLKAYGNDMDSIWEVLQEKLLSDEDYVTLLETMKEEGTYIPEELVEGMESKAQEAANESANTMYDEETSALESKFANAIDVGVKINTDNTITNNALSTEAQNVRKQMENLLTQNFSSTFELGLKVHAATTNTKADVSSVAHNAKGSIIESPTLSWFAEECPEAAIPLDGSARAKSLWVEAGKRLGMYNGYSSEKRTLASQAEQLMNRDSSSTTTSKYLKMLDNTEDGQSNTIKYAPQIIIQGNASKEDVQEASRLAQEEFEAMMERYLRNKKRTAF